MEIRFATTCDVPGIIAILRQAGVVNHGIRPDLFRPKGQRYSPSQVLGLLNDSNAPLFVAVEGENVLGYCFCVMEQVQDDPVLCDRTTLCIDDLCVLEAYRRQGIGTKLYYEILRYAKERGCYNVTLNVWACNESARKFFASVGLKPQKIGMEAIV